MRDELRGIPQGLLKKKPPENRKNIFLFVLMCSFILIFVRPTKGSTVDNDSSVLMWLENFTSKNYDVCDTFVSNSNYKISDYFVSFYSEDTNALYEYTLDKMIDCIENIEIVGIEDSVYTIKVTCKAYEPIKGYVINTELLESISSDYKSGIISDSELRDKLSILYADIYKDSCFNEGSESKTFEVTLEEEDGYVTETVQFLTTLLQEMGVDENLQKYQSEVKLEVGKILEE